MPKTWNNVAVDDFDYVVATVVRAATQLQAISKALHDNKMQSVWSTWTDETPRKASAIATFASETFAELEDQITSIRFNRPCHVQMAKEIASRQIARRKALKESQANVEQQGLVKKPAAKRKKKESQ